jgi:hypothetical protein
MQKKPKKFVGIHLEVALWNAVKVAAIRSGLSTGAWVSETLKSAVGWKNDKDRV